MENVFTGSAFLEVFTGITAALLRTTILPKYLCTYAP